MIFVQNDIFFKNIDIRIEAAAEDNIVPYAWCGAEEVDFGNRGMDGYCGNTLIFR
jgi:hypothetical protein